jgi:peptidyl-prolyl cis-trans isomerase C
MMKRSTLTALLVSTLIGGSLFTYSVVSHAEEKESKTVASLDKKTGDKKSGDYVVMTYKGGQVRKSELDKQWAALFPGDDAPAFDSFDNNVKLEILKNIARERLVLEKAHSKKIDDSAEVKEQLEIAKRQIIIQAYLKSMVNDLVPEKDMRKEYDKIVEAMKGKEEVKARHILVENEKEANELYKKIQGGADFSALAKEKSTDKNSGANGGDLGYFTKERMVPQFADAAFAAEKGKVTKPVKSDFGWHLILVDEKRPVKAPAFEEVKDKIQQGLANKAIETYVNGLFEQSNVKYFAADGKELKEEPVSTAAAVSAGESADAKDTGMDDKEAAAAAAALIEAKKKEEKTAN